MNFYGQLKFKRACLRNINDDFDRLKSIKLSVKKIGIGTKYSVIFIESS